MSTKTVKIKEIADLRSGYHFRGRIKNDPKGNVAVIQMSDVSELKELNLNLLTKTKLNKLDGRLIYEGDILIQNRGNSFSATVIKKISMDTIASPHFFCLRLKNEAEKSILPEYLTWSINQPYIQRQLQMYSASSNTVRMLRREAINKLTIKILPIKKQKTISTISELAIREVNILNQLKELKLKLNNTLIQNYFNTEKTI